MTVSNGAAVLVRWPARASARCGTVGVAQFPLKLPCGSHHVPLPELTASFCRIVCRQLTTCLSARLYDRLWAEVLRHDLPLPLSVLKVVATQATTQDKSEGSGREQRPLQTCCFR
jgi:hypothetical protein